MEDRADGQGVREPSPENGVGLLAGAMTLRRMGTEQVALDTPETRELRARKRQAEEAIEQLKYRKASIDTSEYMSQLERLLIELAEAQQQLDALERQ